MNNEAPEQIVSRVCRCGSLVAGPNACPHCGAGWAEAKTPLTTYRRFDPPAAPTEKKWTPADPPIRRIKVAPAPADERDKQLAQEFTTRWLGRFDARYISVAKTTELLTEFAATVRAEVWRDAIEAAKNELWEDTSAEFGPHRRQQNSVINCVIDALESARTGKVEG